MVLHALHLCSGYGGMELALRLAGIPARTVAHVERDAYAAATLVERMEEAHLDRAPIWSDLTTFDGAAFRGRVDLVTAGFPCQPFSSAGQRRGVDDDRWLWPAVWKCVRDVGPRFLFLENVPQLVRHGLPHVLSDLAEDGWDAEWGLLSAAEAGATHERTRFWLLAHREGGGRSQPVLGARAGEPDAPRSCTFPGGQCVYDECHAAEHCLAHAPGVGRVPGDRPAAGGQDRWAIADAGDVDLDDTEGSRRQGPGRLAVRDGAQHSISALASGTVPDPDGRRLEAVGQLASSPGPGLHGDAHRCWPKLDRWPPGRDDRDGWVRYLAQGGPQPAVRRSTDGRPAELADALHLGGNGLVPAVAALAFVELAARLGVDMTADRLAS